MIYTVKKCFGHDDGLSKFVIIFDFRDPPLRHHLFFVIKNRPFQTPHPPSSSLFGHFFVIKRKHFLYRNSLPKMIFAPNFFPARLRRAGTSTIYVFLTVYSTLMCIYDEKRKTRFVEISRAKGARKIFRVYMVKLQIFFCKKSRETNDR